MNGVTAITFAVALLLLANDVAHGQSPSGPEPDRFAMRRFDRDAQWLAERERLTILDHQFIEHLKILGAKDQRYIKLEYSLRTDWEMESQALVFHTDYRWNGQLRAALVYSPNFQMWPAVKQHTLIICDAELNPLHWREVGNGSIFRSAEMNADLAGQPVLSITYSHRQGHSSGALKTNLGKYDYPLGNDRIAEVGGVEWIYRY